MPAYSAARGEVWQMFDHIDFGSNVTQVSAADACRVLRLSAPTGDGFMTMYHVFDGVYLMYNDFHLRECPSQMQGVQNVFCIGHCREGRMEQRLNDRQTYFMEPGTLRIDRRVHHRGQVILPTCHYHGITLAFDIPYAQAALQKACPTVTIDLEALAQQFCAGDRPTVLRGSPGTEALFYPLYHLPGQVEMDYLRVKVLEILVYLKTQPIREADRETAYFYADQVEKIRAVHDYLLADLSVTHPLPELAAQFSLAETALKRCFKQMYGTSVYAYLKGYRLQPAALWLRAEPDTAVAEIAQRVGYGSHSKFSAAFRAQFGVTPQEYRERNAGDLLPKEERE